MLGADKTLRYYKDEEASRTGKNAGVIELDEQSTSVMKGSTMDPDHPFYFEVATQARTFMLCAPTAEDLNEWILALTDGEGGEEGGAAAGGKKGERSESVSSMASFIASGPLVEVHSGWMMKKGSGGSIFGGKMQKRYFVLYDNRELHYFEGRQPSFLQPSPLPSHHTHTHAPILHPPYPHPHPHSCPPLHLTPLPLPSRTTRISPTSVPPPVVPPSFTSICRQHDGQHTT